MEILKNKKVLIGGVVVLALAGYWYFKQQEAKKLAGSTTAFKPYKPAMPVASTTAILSETDTNY